MISIKKVSVSPLPRNEASVIDSLSSNDDKTINAPSIRAVNEGLGGKANSTHTHTKSQITDFAHNHDDRYYQKTESDTKYKLQGDFAVLTGIITLTSGVGQVTTEYPTGFSGDNCVVINSAIQYTGNWNEDGNTVVLGSNNVILNSNITGPTGDKNYKIVLMKVS